MSCSTCNQVENGMTGLDYEWQGTSLVFHVHGESYRLDKPLVRTPHTPQRGWSAEIAVNGQRHTVTGKTPAETYRSASTLLSLNSVDVTPATLWLNLQVQWLSRTAKKYRLVELSDVFAAAAPAASGEMDKHAIQPWSSSDWGNRVWLFLGLYLSGDEYNQATFVSLVETSLNMVNPANNRLLGNADSFISYNSCVSSLRKSPPYKQEEARSWLVETMRTLGLKMGVGRDLIASVEQINRWKP